MGRSLKTTLPEATFIGLLSVVMYYILKFGAGVSDVNLSNFLLGFLLHLMFEYSPFGNINEMWCRATF